MKTFKNSLSALQAIHHKFDEQSNALKLSLLKEIALSKLPFTNTLNDYYNILLFLCAHPLNNETLNIVERELSRLSLALKNASKTQKVKFINSGLPNTQTVSVFSHDLLKWMIRSSYKVGIDSFSSRRDQLSNVLQYTLPSIEKEITSLELSANKLFDSLKIKSSDRIPFLLSEFDKLNVTPFIKDHFFESLQLYVKVDAADRQLSKAANRLNTGKIFYHKEILKTFDHKALFDTKLPGEKKFSKEVLKSMIVIVKNSLILLQRETDPVTYMDESSFRIYELERGVSVAIYGMRPERQLPIESYVGYTLFKNGFPAAYGGGWVFGKRSLFGINIFESFRGGESGYIMCQLLRVYRQVFGINYFEVEPYQYGKDNPEGIRSGAFWFYYRYGFRPIDKVLKKLSLEEAGKIQETKGYRTSEEILRKFTKSNLFLSFEDKLPVSLWDIRAKVTEMISIEYSGNRNEAENACVKMFLKKTENAGPLELAQKEVLKDVALIAHALKINSPSKIKLLVQMVKTKPTDLYGYQKIVLRLFN